VACWSALGPNLAEDSSAGSLGVDVDRRQPNESPSDLACSFVLSLAIAHALYLLGFGVGCGDDDVVSRRASLRHLHHPRAEEPLANQLSIRRRVAGIGHRPSPHIAFSG
jgi:hypothetical protein